MKKKLILFIFCELAFFLSLSMAAGADGLARIYRVQDGDSVIIFYKGAVLHVRLIGIDAPELGQWPWGIKAKRHLEDIMAGTDYRVRVETDVERHDRYGRLLAYLWTKGGVLINYLMVKDGYAVMYTFPPNVKHVDMFLRAQRVAREEGLGVWGENGIKETPYQWRRRHRGGVY